MTTRGRGLEDISLGQLPLVVEFPRGLAETRFRFFYAIKWLLIAPRCATHWLLMKNHRIEKQIEMKAPVARVWRALTNYKEFGQWFGVKFTGPLKAGKILRGRLTYPGYEHVALELLVKKIQ